MYKNLSLNNLVFYAQNNLTNIKNNSQMRKYIIDALKSKLNDCTEINSNLLNKAREILNILESKELTIKQGNISRINDIEINIEKENFKQAFILIKDLQDSQAIDNYKLKILNLIAKKYTFDINKNISNAEYIKKITPEEIQKELFIVIAKNELNNFEYFLEKECFQYINFLIQSLGHTVEREIYFKKFLKSLEKLIYVRNDSTTNLNKYLKIIPKEFHRYLYKIETDKKILNIPIQIEKQNYNIAYKMLDLVDDEQKKQYKLLICQRILENICFDENFCSNANKIMQNLSIDIINILRNDILNLYIKQIEYLDGNENNFIENCPIFIQRDLIVLGFIIPNLEKFNFIEADNFYKQYPSCIEIEQYEKIKAKHVQKYFDAIDIPINEEQAIAISKMAQNNLIIARAGSGKTRTIACRAIYAMKKENIKPEEIMIVAFNRDAAEEIRNRIRLEFKYKNFIERCARTFHSLAYGIFSPTEDLLWDEGNDDTKQRLTMFVSKLYHSEKIWNKNFKELFYLYFRGEDEKYIDDRWKFDSDEDRYLYYRNRRFISLNGERVKSNGEKWIADFLFEHGINYKYEKVFSYEREILYRPDFTILNENEKIILEHWGIDITGTNKTVPQYWTKDWHEYYEEISWKRNLCKRKNRILLETSILDLEEGRNHFENILKTKLESIGIICNKIPKEILLSKLDSKFKDDMAKKFVTFIQTAHKCKMSSKDILNVYKSYNLSERANAFIELALIVYTEYEEELKKQFKLDFDNLLVKATNKIKIEGAETQINIGHLKQRIDKFKLLLIDEYQDFSQMFYDLVEEIRKNNPNIRLFCVGDNWQAINGFAGSELKFFENYQNYYSNSNNVSLTYNYRSGNAIVELGNKIMQGKGVPAKSFKNIKVQMKKYYIDDVLVFENGTQQFDKQFMYDGRDSFFEENHRYFKLCYNIIKDNKNKKFIILHRTNNLCLAHKLSEFEQVLVKKLKQDNIPIKELKVNTIHKFKGKEADIVIVLECDNKNFPFIHPDNEIYQIFGKTKQDIIDEERRLFYVAVTRAKEKIYFLSDKSDENNFIKKQSNIFCDRF